MTKELTALDAAATLWEEMIREEAEFIANRENACSGCCGPYGTETWQDYEQDVRERFEEIGKAFVRTVSKADQLAALQARVDALEGENARLRKMAAPEWFYLAGDTSSDRCRFSPEEVIDEDWLYDRAGEGSAVVHIETATRCPDIWCAVRFFTDEEKDARQSDDDYELTEHASEDEARAALEVGGGDVGA